MSRITGRRTRARWAVGAAAAAIAVLAVAGPAAADTEVGVGVSGAVTVAGQVTLYGVYTCDPAAGPYAEISVSAVQPDGAGGTVEATAYDRIPCTGVAEAWQETLTPRHAGAWFSGGSLQADVVVWTPGAWADRSEASQYVWVA